MTASVVSFLLGNGLMVVAGAWCAMVYQQADIVEVMILQGFSFAALIMLCLNLWTIQGPTIYNVSAAACHLLRSERRRTATLVAAGRRSSREPGIGRNSAPVRRSTSPSTCACTATPSINAWAESNN